jgi:hypothetical protein
MKEYALLPSQREILWQSADGLMEAGLVDEKNHTTMPSLETGWWVYRISSV